MKQIKTKLLDFGGGNGHACTEEAIQSAVKKYMENNNGSSVVYGHINPSDYAISDMHNLTHKVDLNSLKIEDGDLCCDVDIYDTPDGQIVQEMIDFGDMPTFGLRREGDDIISIDII